MLRGIRSSHLLQHLCPRTPSCTATGAQPGDPGFLPRLRDATATFLFSGSTSSKAEHMSQRHTHTEDTEMAGYTDCCRQGALTYRTHLKHSQVPFLLFGLYR